jgi:hypothetical protein
VPHRPYVQVRLCPLKLLLCHKTILLTNKYKKQFLNSAMRAPNGIRTHDLALTKGALYQLSYEGLPLYKFCFCFAEQLVWSNDQWTVKDSNLRRALPI